jgi:hypothetical protein
VDTGAIIIKHQTDEVNEALNTLPEFRILATIVLGYAT